MLRRWCWLALALALAGPAAAQELVVTQQRVYTTGTFKEVHVEVKVKNYGETAAEDVVVECSIRGDQGSTNFRDQSRVGTLAPGDSATVTFKTGIHVPSDLASSMGTFTVQSGRGTDAQGVGERCTVKVEVRSAGDGGGKPGEPGPPGGQGPGPPGPPAEGTGAGGPGDQPAAPRGTGGSSHVRVRSLRSVSEGSGGDIRIHVVVKNYGQRDGSATLVCRVRDSRGKVRYQEERPTGPLAAGAESALEFGTGLTAKDRVDTTSSSFSVEYRPDGGLPIREVFEVQLDLK